MLNDDAKNSDNPDAAAIKRIISFLQHSSTQATPLPERLRFLKQKGVTAEQIEKALAQCGLQDTEADTEGSNAATQAVTPAVGVPWLSWLLGGSLSACMAFSLERTQALSARVAAAEESTQALRSQLDELAEVSHDIAQKHTRRLDVVESKQELLKHLKAELIAELSTTLQRDLRATIQQEMRLFVPPPPATSPPNHSTVASLPVADSPLVATAVAAAAVATAAAPAGLECSQAVSADAMAGDAIAADAADAMAADLVDAMAADLVTAGAVAAGAVAVDTVTDALPAEAESAEAAMTAGRDDGMWADVLAGWKAGEDGHDESKDAPNVKRQETVADAPVDAQPAAEEVEAAPEDA